MLNTLKTTVAAGTTVAAVVLAATFPAQAADKAAVAEHYANVAHAVFEDSLITGTTLQTTLNTFLANPTEKTLAEAKTSWKAARVPYQQSEVFRFGNTVVDDWEGQLNAWPLDEGLIDYVDNSYASEMGNIGATVNIIANASISLGDSSIDARKITPVLLASLNELGGSEANVATGYHAIEFLLWGQDLNGTKTGAGSRPYTDYVQGKGCTNGNCDRRAAYLQAAADLLVSDLADMEAQWKSGGEYRKLLLAKDTKEVFTIALYGMGSLSLGELAGERMKVSLEANSPEDEHDCFSDNTHYSHYYDALGVRNIYTGEYKRVDGSVLKGPSMGDLVAEKDAKLHKAMQAAFQLTDDKLMVLVNSAESGEAAFDQMIAEGNARGYTMVSEGIAALVAQTELIEKVANVLDIDNLNPDTADHEF